MVSVQIREVRRRGNHQRDYSLGREVWVMVNAIETHDTATSKVRCECGSWICFDTEDGHLVALDALTRVRHQCTGG